MTTLIDLETLRARLRRAEQDNPPLARLWRTMRRQVRADAQAHAWSVPLVAAVTRDETLAAEARAIIGDYLDAAEQGSLGAGVQFHFWCYAFPHARWAIWFDLLAREGLWGDRAEATAARFLTLQLRDFHSGLLVKPYPECVDNQAASLTLASLAIGTLFADGPAEGRLAHAMRDEALNRAEGMIGGMPPGGYNGEGSTYQGTIVAFLVPLLVELLEAATGDDWFERPCAPHGTTAAAILRAVARLQMPSGLLLPWDDYGYMTGLKSPLAWWAARTGDAAALAALETADWSNTTAAGWGYDDHAWALAWWPQRAASAAAAGWSSWAEAGTGAALVSPDGSRYLMQMWDPAAPQPMRQHVNPNALVLEAFGTPLTVDGTPADDCTAFHYDDTWVTRGFIGLTPERVNFGKGCGGAHNVLLIDGVESLRPREGYAPQHLVSFDAEAQEVVADVTGLYRSVWPDARRIRRRSCLVANDIWIVEDLAQFDQPHRITSRWFFRPGATAVDGGLDLTTPEGVRLQMRALLGPAQADLRRIDGYPRNLDGSSDRVVFQSEGATVRWLWLLRPAATRDVAAVLDTGWTAWNGPPDAGPAAAWGAASDADARTWPLAPGGEPWSRRDDVPPGESWWYTRTVEPPDEPWWLALPARLPASARLWFDGEEVDLSPHLLRGQLLAIHIPGPDRRSVRITLHIPMQVGHYPRSQARPGEGQPGKPLISHRRELTIPDAPPALLTGQEPLLVRSAAYDGRRIVVALTDDSQVEVDWTRMETEGAGDE